MKAILLLKGIFSSIRLHNLAIICLSLFLVRYAIVKPILELTGYSSAVADEQYILLVCATVFIAAAGYIINDFFDKEIDVINKPHKNNIGIVLSSKAIIVLYMFMNIAGLFLIWYFGELTGKRYALLVFIFSAGLLYFYSSSYKKMLLVGNIIISFLAALTISLSILFDSQALLSEPVKLLVSAYAIFAFAMTLIREIIKDCEDISGDQAYGATTLPVVSGVKIARIIAGTITIIVLITIIYIQVMQQQWLNIISFSYSIICIQLPLIFLMIRNFTAKNKNDDKWNSRLSKIIMVTGLLSMLIFQLTSN